MSAVRIHTGICHRFYLFSSCEGLEPFGVHEGRQLCTLFSLPRESVIEVTMHEQYNFEPAEIVECSQKEVPGRRAIWL